MKTLKGGAPPITFKPPGEVSRCDYCERPEGADVAIWKVAYARQKRQKEKLACDAHMESALHDAEQEAFPITSIVITRIA